MNVTSPLDFKTEVFLVDLWCCTCLTLKHISRYLMENAFNWQTTTVVSHVKELLSSVTRCKVWHGHFFLKRKLYIVRVKIDYY